MGQRPTWSFKWMAMVVSVFLLSRLLVDLNIPVTTADDPLLPIPPEDAPVDETEAAPLGTSRRISGVVSGGDMDPPAMERTPVVVPGHGSSALTQNQNPEVRAPGISPS